MKKKLFVGSIVFSFFALALGNIIFNASNNSNSELNDVINEEELFVGQEAHKIDPKMALANDELLEPKMGVQLSSVVDNKRSIRFIGVIQDLNVSCSFTRTIYDEESSYNSGSKVYDIDTAYSSIRMGDASYTPDDFGFTGYKYFVTYTLKNVPATHWYHISDVSLEVSGNTSDGETLTKTGTNKANVHGAMKSYYNSTFTFNLLSDNTYSMVVNEDAKDEETYLIPEYVNTYDGNVASKGALITAYGDNAFRGCSNITSLTISKNIKSIGASAFKGCSNLNEVYFENDLEAWCNLTFADEYANPMAYASSFKLLNSSSIFEELTSIEIPTSITEIGDYQFYNFKNITNLVIHDDVISFGIKAFYNFSSLDTLYYNETIDIYNTLTFGDDFHSDPSNYAKTFFVLNSSSEYEEYEKPTEEEGEEDTPDTPEITKISISKYAGHLESLYAEWTPYSGATGYNAYYKLSSASSWTQVDTELIRSYGSYIRVDAVGLKAGSYNLKVIPIVSSSELEAASATCTMEVKAHDRSGYAFVNGTSSGAYNDDGTLKSNAVVLYVTNDNKDTVTVTPNIGDGGKSFTGIGNIIMNWQSKYDTRPLNVRFIGNIEDPAFLDKGDILVQSATQGVTLEGIGNDAVANGWGIRIKGASNVEIRNLGLMNCDSSEGDNIGLQQDNDHIWVHNNDFFYGDAGSDADQAKGDGALDTKKTQYVTHSYNHFWDTGKTHLNGNGDTVNNYISYHHNWYDHSDSRHPRVRKSPNIHVYNNYFDGVSKYGAGATTGSSIYMEGNYFRSCKYPMLISLQGNDGGTFSGEDGGMIKAYDNYMTGTYTFSPYSSSNTVEFDAYVVENRNDTVPSSVTSKEGGNSYSNFDTASDFYDYFYESPEDAKNTVMNWSGRVEGGDFDWTFTTSDDTDYDVNTGLKSALTNYETTLVSVGGNSISGDGGDVSVDASVIIGKIAALANAATLENIEEIKTVYAEYLTYDTSLVTNSSKIIRLYNEALALEESYFEDLVYFASNNLTLANLNNATSWYEKLSASQQSNVSEYKALLDELYVEYELIAVDNVIDLINALPSVDAITLADETNVNSVVEAYNALSESQQNEVTNYDKLVDIVARLDTLKNQEIADEFMAKVDELPSSTSALVAADLATIETLLADYNNLDSDVQGLIPTSYITKLNNYKTYIETYLVTEKTVTLTSADLSDNTSGTTKNGFIYQTNGLSGEYIKVKNDNHITYEVETSSIELELVAKCVDSSDAKDFTITITYKDGSIQNYTYTLAEDKKDATYNETYTGDIVSIKINGLENKNLGVLSLSLTYTTSASTIDEDVVAFEALVSDCETSLTKENLDAAYAKYETLTDEQIALVSEAKATLDTLNDNYEAKVAFEALVSACETSLTKENLDAAYANYETLSTEQIALVSEAKATLDALNNDYEEAYEVYTNINNLPSVESVTLDDEEAINAIKTNYEALTTLQKTVVTNYENITALENRIAELKVAKNSADSFIASVDELPSTTDGLVLDDLTSIEALLNDYASFDEDTKSFIDISYVNKLNEYKTYINDNLVDVPGEGEGEEPTGEITIGGVFDDWSKEDASTPFEDLWNSN